MQNRLINLSLLINEYKDRVYDLMNYASCSQKGQVKDELFSKTFIDIFRSIKNTKVKYPVHLMVYDKAKDVICKDKKTNKKKIPNIKELRDPVDISSLSPLDLRSVNIIEHLEYLEPKDRLVAIMALRHNVNINELSTVFSTSTGAILTKIGRIKAELARTIYAGLKNQKEPHQYETTKLCFSVRNMEPQYSLGLLSREEQTKISRHISKCQSCKNFYSWNERVAELLHSAPEEKAPASSSNMVFEHLEGKVIDDTAIHYVRTGWKTRLAILALILISAATLYYYIFYPGRGTTTNNTEQNMNMTTPSAINEHKILMTINIPASNSEIEGIKEAVKETAQMFSYASDPAIDQDGLKYVFFTQAQSKSSMLEKFGTLSNVSIEEHVDNEKAADEIIKVELSITPNGS